VALEIGGASGVEFTIEITVENGLSESHVTAGLLFLLCGRVRKHTLQPLTRAS